MSNADKPAFPISAPVLDKRIGLTKREYFAGLAMQAVLAADIDAKVTPEVCAKHATDYADALLAQLEESQ